MESASALIDEKIKELGDWRGKTLAKVREIVHKAQTGRSSKNGSGGKSLPRELRLVHSGIVCTGETYKSVVKMTFSKGAALKDPSGLFSSSLDGNVRRVIDIHEGDEIDEGLEGSHPRCRGAQSQGQEQAEEQADSPANQQQADRLASSQAPAHLMFRRKAVAAGGATYNEPKDHGFMISTDFRTEMGISGS